MEFDITKNSRNELLQRREIDFTLRFDGATPRRTQITGKLAALLNVSEKQMVLDSLKTILARPRLRVRPVSMIALSRGPRQNGRT